MNKRIGIMQGRLLPKYQGRYQAHPLGYWKNENETDKKIIDGWLHTGDYAILDEEGNFYFKGRKDDLINSSGYRIGPSEIENTILSIDEVDKGILGGNNGTRRIQIGLALFYLSVGKTEFATSIAEDYLDDLAYFDEKTFKANANTQCFLLSIFGPHFWEDTDRGTLNIYFAPEKDQIDPFKELLFGLMDKRLEALERDVKFLSLEVDKLMQKRKRQDGYLNDTDKERMEELQRKISAREKTEEESAVDWSIDHDILYSLLCISFFADQEIDESEKSAIFDSYKIFIPDLDSEIFTRDFGMTTDKFIELETENKRQKQFDESLLKLNQTKRYNESLSALVECFIDIANADDFIHENEIILIQRAIDIWSLDVKINKPKSGEKLALL